MIEDKCLLLISKFVSIPVIIITFLSVCTYNNYHSLNNTNKFGTLWPNPYALDPTNIPLPYVYNTNEFGGS